MVHYVHMCMKCQNTKVMHKKKFGLYRPLPILTSLFENVLMDFMTCVPLWQDKDVIFVVVEIFYQLIKFVSTKKIGCKQDILYILVTLFFI